MTFNQNNVTARAIRGRLNQFCATIPRTFRLLKSISVDVRFGSEADMCNAPTHVRFTTNSDRKSGFPQNSCLLYPRKQTCVVQWRTSALGQKPHRLPTERSTRCAVPEGAVEPNVANDTSNSHADRRAGVGKASKDRRNTYTNDIRSRPTGSNRLRP